MAHFAKLDSNNIVENVIVISNEILKDSEGNEVEQLGIDFCKSLYGENTNWVQTSYNSNIRKQYAGIGYTYNETNDVFISIKPFNSWTLDSNFDWQPPTPYPSGNKGYSWNEEDQAWDEFIPPQPFDSWTWNEEEWRWESPTPMPTDGGIWNEETISWDLITE